MPRKRRSTPFSLSFLDIMACGFGAVTLLFLILRHDAIKVESPDIRLSAEVNLLQQDVSQAESEKAELLNSLDELKLQLVDAQGLSRRIVTQLQEAEKSIQAVPEEEIAMLRRQVEELER